MSQAEPILGISRFSAQLGSNQLGSAGLATLSRAVATLGLTEKAIGATKGKRCRVYTDPYAGGERPGKLAKPDAVGATANRRARDCYEHRPLGKRFKRHVTVGITPDRFKRVTSHLTSDRNTLTNTHYSGTPKSCNHNDTTGKWCHFTLFSHWIISRS